MESDMDGATGTARDSRLRASGAEVEDECPSLASSGSSGQQGGSRRLDDDHSQSSDSLRSELRSLFAKQLNEVQELLMRQHQRVLEVAERESTAPSRREEGEALDGRRGGPRLRSALAGSGATPTGSLTPPGEKSAGTGEASDTGGSFHAQPRRKRTPGAMVSQSGRGYVSEGDSSRLRPSLRWSPSALHGQLNVQSEIAEPDEPMPPIPLNNVELPPGRPSILALEHGHNRGLSGVKAKSQIWAVRRSAFPGAASSRCTTTDTESVSSFPSQDMSARRFPPSPLGKSIRRMDARVSGLTGLDSRDKSVGVPAKRKTIRDGNQVFADADLIKERVRKAILEKEYHVFDCYKTDGFFQWLARTQGFEIATLCVILCNALWMSFDTEKNLAEVLTDAEIYFQVAEHFFCTYFTLEALVRYFAFRRTMDALKDAWFVFDTALVVLMIVETWVMTAIITLSGERLRDASLGDAAILKSLRLLRLTRMARVVRLLRACPEVMILIKGIVIAGPSVFFTLVLLVCGIYVFGIAFTELARDTEAGFLYFSSVFSSMSTLLLHGCFGENLPDVVYALGQESILYAALLMLFVLFASLMVMNMLMAALVEVVQVVSAVEKESLVVNFVKRQMQGAIDVIEPGFDGTISKLLFAQLLEHPNVIRALREVGVDVVELVDFTDYIFHSGDQVDFSTFMEMVLQLRGSNKATLKDVIDLRKRLVREIDERIRANLADRPRTPRAVPMFYPIVRAPGAPPEKDEEEV